MGFDYDFPNLLNPCYFARLILEDDQGRPVMALLARKTCEMYLLIDNQSASPGGRLRQFLTLHRAMEDRLILDGYEDAHAFVPPGSRMDKFKRLLSLLGW